MFAKITALFKLRLFEEQERSGLARNLVALLIIVILGTSIQIIVRLLTIRTVDELVVTFSVIFVISLVFLGLVRRGHFTIPRYALPIIFLIAFIYLTVTDHGLHDNGLPGFVLAILLGGLLNGRRGAILFSILAVLSVTAMGIGEVTGVLVSPLSSDTHGGDVVLVALEFAFIGFVLTLVFNNLLENVTEARQATVELRELSQSLERKVADRTRDLTLAMEAGHKILGVHDLNKLFQDAVDLICEQFNLYYGQIYLVDDKEQRLVIRAGTGSVGAELMRRAHFLPVNSSSINGQAVVERQAIIVADTKKSPNFRLNPLLPDTRSETAVPLILDGRVMGVLNLQDNKPETFSLEMLPVFRMVADQLAVAMQNARLFTEIAQARAEVEAAARRLAREGWDDYLDGVTQEERIGVQYDLAVVKPLTDEILAISPDQNALQVPVMVANEPIGVIQVEAGDGRFWTEETLTLVTAVARQVGQQAENLRLLAETNRYRAEAEQAARRLRGEAWRDYLAGQSDLGQGFVYNQQQVKPLHETTSMGNGRDRRTIHQPLKIHGDVFGELLVEGMADPDTEALVATVAEQLSSHLENLRLLAQTEKALAETAEQARRLAALNEISRDLSAVTDAAETFAVLARHMPSVIPHDFLSFALAKPNGTSAKVVAIINDQPVTIFEDQPIAGTVVEVATQQRQLVYLADIREHDYEDTNTMAERAGARSVMIAPLITARGVLGAIDLMSNQVDAFDAQDKTLLQQIASLMASTLESQQLFAEAQKQAAKERLVNLVSQKIQRTVTIESALETTITELGKALQARYTQAELSLVKEPVQES